ncbi:hypothetical protein [Sphingopyxis sp. GW247-27LB]|uniref:hypothetical protein n=1 Tax=Sphingopyxis sp. GW247-27LB TaxID=2012632 RepID=UPI000BA62450|nr:hypothetical protein [Sphingopyxis sp. GW247-27LB]PAL25477.1 hypothetical protein CD928_03115 [Sphingopyxis sp. GW247-27LB]
MIGLALVLVVWLGVANTLVRLKPVRARPDAWPLVLLWPLAVAGIVGILVYEFFYRLGRSAWRRVKAVRR